MMDRFPYVPLPERPKLVWPEGKRLAVWVLPNIEHYEYRPEFVNRRNAWPRMPAPDIIGYGVRDYGNRVGRVADARLFRPPRRQGHGLA